VKIAGEANKVIADELEIAVRTVEVHRARVLEKMGVRSAVELARLMEPKHQDKRTRFRPALRCSRLPVPLSAGPGPVPAW